MPHTPPHPTPLARHRPALRVVRGGAAPAGHGVAARDAACGAAIQRVIESITAAIIERRLLPGTRLAERKLAAIFRASRTLVRHALIQLSRDGLVRLQPARGASVAAPNMAEARQLFAARQLIEGALIKQLARAITPPQIAQLRAHLQAERAAVGRGDVAARTRLLAEFHVLLARLLGNDVLAQVLTDLLTRSSLLTLMAQSHHAAELACSAHAAIVDALESGDAREATRLMQRHLCSVERQLRLERRRPDLALVLKQP
jgi:DNA-binding GntR family transcriptional regulator